MEKNVEVAILLDIYGELLTDKQRDVIDLYYNQDLSLGEIAAHQQITRQGVRDSIKRGEEYLYELEDKLGLLKSRQQLQEDMLQKLYQDQLNCLDLLSDGVKGLSYDPKNEYSVPYFWGTVGIVYDKNKVSEEDLEKEGFNIFLDQKYKGDIYLYDSERDSFMMALKALGYSMNTSDEKELNEAYEWLLECVNTMEPEIVTDEIIDNMAQGRKALGLVYSGDAAYIMSENEDMGFYLPESGTNLWSDAMVIPKNAKNVELAHAFINFVSEYEGAMDNSSFVGYTSPNEEVMLEMSQEGGEYEGINAYLPRTGYEKDEVFRYDEDTRKIIANLFAKVKVAASNAS